MTDFPFTADVVLLNSGETARKGMYVEMGLHHEIDGPICPEDRNPFMDFDQGREKGQRFRVTFHLLADDEKSTEPNAERPKGGDRAKRAGILCNDPAFQKWIGALDEAEAADRVRVRTGVGSRAELDHYSDCAQHFDDLVDAFYRDQRGDTDAARLAQRDRT